MNKMKNTLFRFLPIIIPSVLIAAVVVAIGFLAFSLLTEGKSDKKEVGFSKFISQVKETKVESVVIRANTISVRYNEAQELEDAIVVIPYYYDALIPTLLDNDVDVRGGVEDEDFTDVILIDILPILLIALLFWFIITYQVDKIKSSFSHNPENVRDIVREEMFKINVHNKN